MDGEVLSFTRTTRRLGASVHGRARGPHVPCSMHEGRPDRSSSLPLTPSWRLSPVTPLSRRGLHHECLHAQIQGDAAGIGRALGCRPRKDRILYLHRRVCAHRRQLDPWPAGHKHFVRRFKFEQRDRDRGPVHCRLLAGMRSLRGNRSQLPVPRQSHRRISGQ